MNKNKKLSFEDRMQRLQEIVTLLESGENCLEESVAMYKEGLTHAVACRDLLAKARHEIEMCVNGQIEPLEIENSADDEQTGIRESA